MITNKDLSIDSENGKITLNGNKYDLGTQGEIDTAVKDVYSIMGQMGAKNLIPYPYYESDHTESGITWTVNSDGSVTANGTATANSTFIFRQRTEQTRFVEKNTSYILSGCPSGGSNSKYMLYLFVQTQEPTNITSGTDYGNGATINMPDQDYYGIYAFARVVSGQTVSNLTFKPMLRLASDTDDTYQPYAMTNKQLTEQLGALSDRLIVVNGTLAATADSAVIQYPSGVNKTDWYVIGWNFTLNNNKYSGFGIGGADKSLSIVMGDENISVYNDDTALFSKSISIILAKL